MGKCIKIRVNQYCGIFVKIIAINSTNFTDSDAQRVKIVAKKMFTLKQN